MNEHIIHQLFRNDSMGISIQDMIVMCNIFDLAFADQIDWDIINKYLQVKYFEN